MLLVEALASTNVLESILGKDETVDIAIKRAKSYFLICSVVKNVLVIGLGKRLLTESKEENGEATPDDQERQNSQPQHDSQQHDETSPLLPHRLDDLNHKFHGTFDRQYSRLPPNAQTAVTVLGELVNPASVGAIIAAIIGLTPALHHAFFAKQAIFTAWLTASLQNIGGLFTALQIFVVGGLLNSSLQQKGGNKAGISKSGLLIAFFIRFVFWSWYVMLC